MNSWEKLPIGEIFSIEKGSLQSTKCTPGEFTFITASSEWKSHNEYSHDCEALIYAVAASGSLGRCHYYQGKFISSDLCFILRAKDAKKKPINYRFYQNIFKFLKNDIVSKTKAGTSKESISQKRLSSYYLPYIDIDHQEFWETKLNNLNKTCKSLYIENKNQSSYLTQLRQAILQEAIEGKLTADWRKENPFRKGDPDYDAEALLEKIKAEKERQVKEGGIKKQKPLAPIKPEEVPFELPEGWVWCKIGEVSYKITDGTHFTPQYKSSGIQFVSAKDIKSGELIFDNCKFISKEEHEKLYSRCNPEEADIIISKSGSIGTVVLNKYKHQFSLFESLALVKYFSKMIAPSYMQLCVQFSCNNLKREDIRGVAVKHLHLEVLRTLLIAIPPLTEQQTIVDRVEKLLSMVDELEKQVLERKEHSEQLMKAVLREAFEGSNHA